VENRVYGERVSISEEETRNFWDSRAEMAEHRGSGAVLCGDQAKDAPGRKDAYDREYILPRLNITKDSRVLDVGCGIGRIAGMVIPLCGAYWGTDFSSEMIKAAEKRNTPRGGGTARFRALSFSETMERDAAFFGGGFDVLLSFGVHAYINDEDLTRGFRQMPRLLNGHATLCFQELVGLGKRLTLDRFPSKELHTNYSVIYRMREEYMDLYAPLFQAGFSIQEEGMIPDYGNSHVDSDRWYIIMRR